MQHVDIVSAWIGGSIGFMIACFLWIALPMIRVLIFAPGERVPFERWCRLKNMSTLKTPDKTRYINHVTQLAWESWLKSAETVTK